MIIRSQRPIYDRTVGKSPKYPHTNFQWHIKCGLAFSSIKSDSSDDDLYKLDLDPEGQDHQ